MVKYSSYGNATEIIYDGCISFYNFDLVEIKNIKRSLEKFPFQEITVVLPNNIDKSLLVKFINDISPKESFKNKNVIVFKL